MGVDKNFERMGQYRQTVLLVDRRDGFLQRQAARNRLCDPQGEHVPIAAADLDTRHNIERIARAMFVGPQAGFKPVMIGYRDDIQAALRTDIIQQFGDGGPTVTGRRVHVQIRQTSSSCHDGFLSLYPLYYSGYAVLASLRYRAYLKSTRK